MSRLFAPPTPAGVPRSIAQMMDQGKWWKTADEGWVRIKDLTPAHRLNAAKGMMRAAATIEFQYGWNVTLMLGNADDGVAGPIMDELDNNSANPRKWLRRTKLYRKMIKGLAPDMRTEDGAIA